MTNILTDAAIQSLVVEPKPMPGGLIPWGKQIERNQHRRKEFEIEGYSGSLFLLSTRQNMINKFDFSVILGYRMPGLNTVFRLRRYNGKSHYHSNPIEGSGTFREFHMHIATERYQRRAGSKEDHFAVITNRYASLDGAIECMLADCGFPAPLRSLPLFPEGVE